MKLFFLSASLFLLSFPALADAPQCQPAVTIIAKTCTCTYDEYTIYVHLEVLSSDGVYNAANLTSWSFSGLTPNAAEKQQCQAFISQSPFCK